jgi:hypothetical protein
MGGEKSDGAGVKKDNAEKAPETGSSPGGRRFFTIAVIALIVLALILAAAVIIFRGNDGPGSKIDYSGMYAGEDPSNSIPVPGHPDLYARSVAAVYENDSAIYITENRKAVDPSFGKMISFVANLTIPREKYETGHVCSSFAVELHDQAELAGMRAHIVFIRFTDNAIEPHLIDAFRTTDRGVVYVDVTGRTPYEIKAGYPATYRLADVVPGEPYVRHYPAPFQDFEEYISMGNVSSAKFLA